MNIPNAFERLDPDIQRMLWDMKWTSLHGFQVDAINAWFDTERDLLLMAHTAAGKTEAAFLPALSTIAPDRGRGSVRVMYVGPLKALINDQFRRVEDLCVRAEIPVHRWHGDVDAKRKRDVVAEPTGVVLITPESLEALLMLKGNQVNRMFSRLEAVIIDELHVFLESARGRQLNSLLARIDAARGNGKRTRRIGLSATIGDVAEAQQWLGGNADNTLLISSSDTGEKELLITTFIHRPQRAFADETATPETDTGSPAETVEEEDDEEVIDEGALLEIAEHVLKRFSGKTNLIFCNRKTDIEELADHLGRLCKRQNVPNEFTVHHGSLSKENREAVEQDLQSGRPHTALCSSTLELGIDVGYIDAVGHVRPPHSVSALKQRIGRSGRREGTVPRMWLYCPVLQVDTQDRLVRQLYPDLVQAIAEVQLMTEGWVEPPFHVTEDLSTLIQQVLSITRERGGTKASELSELLRNTHAFKGMSPQVFAQVLDELKRRDLLEHAEDGDLILGLRGEKLVSHYDFYAAFVAQDEYDVVNGKDHVGSIPIMVEYAPGHRFLLAGRRW